MFDNDFLINLLSIFKMLQNIAVNISRTFLIGSFKKPLSGKSIILRKNNDVTSIRSQNQKPSGTSTLRYARATTEQEVETNVVAFRVASTRNFTLNHPFQSLRHLRKSLRDCLIK